MARELVDDASKPKFVQAGHGYDCERYRAILRQRGICPQIGKRYSGQGSHLGMTRWVVERTITGCISSVACGCVMSAAPICMKAFPG